MAITSDRVDEYIENAAKFARPILRRIRKAFHKGCPEVEETIKWGVPFFMHNGIIGGIAAFKQHVSLGFWKSKQLDDPAALFCTGTGKKASMCNAHFGSLQDLPQQSVLVDYVKRAVELNASGGSKTAIRPATKKLQVVVPVDLRRLLAKNQKAQKTFDSFPLSAQRDYVEWINAAKRPATRLSRLATTLQWLAEGKRRHWKYEPK
jgi:uncharacterized protein YdeI (YjbR/CyaY-like superfamily)